MSFARTANPAMNDQVFTIEGTGDHAMSIQGTTFKTGVLLSLLIVSAAFTWNQAVTNPNLANTLTWGGLIVGLIFAFITIFKPAVAPYTSPIYALAEGAFLGGISLVFQSNFPGIVSSAVALTIGILAAMLMVYSTGLVRATEKFKVGVLAATGGIFLAYLAAIVLGFFGISMPFIHDSGPIGIAFSLFVVVIASLNLVLDFDFIESGVQRGAPKYMEWYGAFGLLVTLVWLYISILRLLSKLRD